MFSTMPERATVNPVTVGNHLSFELTHQSHETPDKQRAFLLKLGWVGAGYHPDGDVALFRKPAPADCTDEERRAWPYDLGSGYWYWYEAVAYEFTKFISIGDDSA